MITHPQAIPPGALSISQITRHLQGSATCSHPGCTKKISGNKKCCAEHAGLLPSDNEVTLIDRLERHKMMEEETMTLMRTAKVTRAK